MKDLFRLQVKLLFPPDQAQELHYLIEHSSETISFIFEVVSEDTSSIYPWLSGFTLSFINVSVLLPSTLAGCLFQELTLTWASAFLNG